MRRQQAHSIDWDDDTVAWLREGMREMGFDPSLMDALIAKIAALEARPVAVPVATYDDAELRRRIEALESARAPEPEVIEKIVEVERVVEVQVDDPRVETLQAEIQRMHEEAAKPQPKTLEALTAPGTMVVEDELKMRRALLTVEIGSYAQDRINARYDVNVRDEIGRFMSDYSNKKALGLPTTALEDDASARANEQIGWIRNTEKFAGNLIQALPLVSVDVLRAYDLEGAGWP